MLTIVHSSKTPSKNNMERASVALDLLLKRKDLGFLQIHLRNSIWQEAAQISSEIVSQYDEMVLVGIGGSSLGPQMLCDLFQTHQTKKLHILDNADPLLFQQTVGLLKDLKKTAWLIVSKSGSTLETLALTEFVAKKYREAQIPFAANTYVISERTENPLTRWAKKNQRPVLEIPLDVGGRFSIFTSVGLVPLAFLGIDLSEVKKGIELGIQNKEVGIQLIAHYLESFDREEWISVLFCYGSALKSFGGWWQQLWAESLAKKVDRLGQPALRASTPFMAVGACDQHSLLQQFMEGYLDKFYTFLRVQSVESDDQFLDQAELSFEPPLKGKSLGQILSAEAQATESALNQIGAHSLCLQIDDLNAKSIAELLTVWQIVVGAMGEALNIDAFNQPGVEIGKKIARKLLST